MFIPAITDKWGPKAFETRKGAAAAFSPNKVGGNRRNFKWQVPPPLSSLSSLSSHSEVPLATDPPSAPSVFDPFSRLLPGLARVLCWTRVGTYLCVCVGGCGCMER
jgi:hypothetical protein